MKFPYGVADFASLRKEGQVYVDRTDCIPLLEELGKSLLFLRPRRFGKSLWLSTLANYYDLRKAADHEVLFGDLAVQRSPTAHQYFILEWDFSDIDPAPPLNDGPRSRSLGAEVHRYLLSTLDTFLARYQEHLPWSIELSEDAFTSLNRVLAAIEQTPFRLYILVDEYDNFANEVMVNDADAYTDMVQSDGPFKRLFKWVKAALKGPALDRIFMTGVSPVVLSDITSGMNVATNVYLMPQLNALCGFTDAEVRSLLEQLHGEPSESTPNWTVEEAHAMMRSWYNGYRFAPVQAISVYNPTLVFYFLNQLQWSGTYPQQMLDANLAVDESKLDYLAGAASGQETVIDLVRHNEPLEVAQILDRFTLRDLLERSSQDDSFLGAYLYYFGMLTLGGQTPRRTLLLETPNEVVRGLYIEHIRRLLLPLGADRTAVMKPAWDLMEGQGIEPLLDFIEEKLFPTFSNRDARWANELTVKTIFLTLLWNPTSYITDSEPELEHRYADLCLLRRPDAQTSSLYDLLFELKRLSLKKLGLRGEEIRSKSRSELRELPEVRKALKQAKDQLNAYRKALMQRQGDALRLNAYAVVALGFERLVAVRVQEPGAPSTH